MSDATQRTPLGAHVKTSPYGYMGRVTRIDRACPESDAWLEGQQGLGDDPMQYRDVRWLSILVHGGGSVAVPDLPGFVRQVEPFTLDNLYAADYFPADEVMATWPPAKCADAEVSA